MELERKDREINEIKKKTEKVRMLESRKERIENSK